MAVAFCFLAFGVGWASVRDLSWPCESDLYRDLGTAQSILDGTAGQDPAYAGERWWYPPLVPALVALSSLLTGTPLHEAYTTAGAFLNLLAPAGFYVMLVVLAGRVEALAGVTAFLFLGQLDLPSWMHATYSPWLWSCNLAQAFFYFSIAAVVHAFRGGRRRRAVLAGVLLGLTSLAHAAPALVLAVVVAVVVGRELALGLSRWRELGVLLGLMALAALVVAWPFWFDILVHYRLRVRNPVPLTWLPGELTVERMGEITGRLVSVRGVVALVGVLGLVVPRVWLPRGTRPVLLAWGGVALLGLGYGYASQRMTLPPLFPSWHFYFSLQAFEAAAFGLGVGFLAALLSFFVRRFRPRARGTSFTGREAFAVVLVLGLAVLVGTRFDAYATRMDLVSSREASQSYARHPVIPVYEWARDRVRLGDAVLATTNPGFFVAAANHRVVVLQDLFSNPYARYLPRARDAGIMLQELWDDRREQLPALIRSYRLRYAVLEASERERYKLVEGLRRVVAAKDRKAGYDVYELRPPLRGTARAE